MSDASGRTVRWRKAAGDDLASIVDYIAADSPDAAERFLDGILTRIATLERFPMVGSVCPHYPKAQAADLRQYIVYYTVSRREVSIRAIVHGARLFRRSWLRRG